MLAVAIELVEKAGLVASAALISVLLPALRQRFFGLRGASTDRLWIIALGVSLSAWGSLLGSYVQGEHMNVRALGVLVAGFLGGPSVGVVTGLLAGLFYAFLSGHVDGDTRAWVILASLIDGVLAGAVGGGAIGRLLPARVAERIRRALSLSALPTSPAPDVVRSPLAAVILACAIQALHLAVVALGLWLIGSTEQHLSAWPAHLAKLLANAGGVALFVGVARLAVENEEHLLAKAKLERGTRDAELRELRRRVDPHFLFNALTSMRALVRVDSARARDALTDLAELYRYSIAQPDEVMLSSEVEHARRYLAFEAARLGPETLRFTVDDVGSDIDRLVPSLILQPLIENAVLHGVRAYKGGGVIDIKIRADERLVIEVRNAPHAPQDVVNRIAPRDSSHNGTAIETLRERLHLRYGEPASFSLSIEGDETLATIVLPQSSRTRS